ncbi:MAG TPA: DUF2911 domain-containing protein [Verrucomicrobiae bacterium]|nr:DUF2911 domain-containing protein [Verrucomicrobiae bacterium]
MNTKAFLSSVVILPALLLAAGASAQTPRLELPSPSPSSTLKQRVGLTDIEINYSRPSARGRPIFGGLLPYGKVWRTGANGPTILSFSTPVKLNGTPVAAGKYALFTIPGEDEWTIILNKDIKGSPLDYHETNDVVRFTAHAVEIAENIETFSIMINAIQDDSARIDLIWEHTAVPIRLNLDLVSELQPKIEAAMSAPGERKPYYQAAMFYFEHKLDVQKAKEWIDEAAKQNATYYITYLQAKIHAAAGDKEGAIAAAKHSSELAAKEEGASGYLKLNQDLIDSLK